MHPALEQFWATYGARFVELMAVGGENPQGYGMIQIGGGLYGRIGLEHEEFYEYLQLRALLEGMCMVLGESAQSWVRQHVTVEIQAQAARVEAGMRGGNET